MRRSRNNETGGAIAFSAILAMVLVLVGVGFLFISMFMGGGREIKNAVDAGALNVGKQVVDNISVDLSGDDNQQFFKDVTDNNDGKVNLRNINRVWAKAMLVALNSDAAGGSGDSGAQSAYEGAQAISDALNAKLVAQANLWGFFTDYAQRNSVRMLGNGTTTAVLPGAGWQTSLMDRLAESNVVVNNVRDSFKGIGYTISNDFYEACTRFPAPQDANGKEFLIGYKPLTVKGRTYWQVPFQFEEKPHLVASSTFASNQQPPNTLPAPWQTAVPNGFSVEGQVVRPDGHNQLAKSWVLTNPHQSFPMAIPHSYIHIHLDDMKSHWYFFPTGYPPISMGLPNDQDYGYTTDTQGSDGVAGGLGCVDVPASDIIVGTDVVGRGLDDIIFKNPDGSDIGKIENDMFNRCTEMITDLQTKLSTSDMHSAIGPTGSLNGGKTYGEMVAGERDFYLYSDDGKSLTIRSKNEALAAAPMWLKTMINSNGDDDADGSETLVVDDASMIGAIVVIPDVNVQGVGSNTCPIGTIDDPFPFGWGTWEKDVGWTPGSGFNGCLGKVRVKRYTNVYLEAICPPC